jgi:hypothetical protein
MSLWLTTSLQGLPLMREADWREITLLDWRVLGGTAAVMLVSTLFVSLAPILRLRHLAIAASAQHATARASLAQRLAGTAQIAVAGAFGAAAIAFGWYLAPLMFGYPGYEVADRYLAFMRIFTDAQAERERQFIEAVPGVTAVAFGLPVPPTGDAGYTRAIVQHPEDPTRTINVFNGVAEQPYIDLLGLEVLYGRVVDRGDSTGVLVNQTLARALWGRDDVVGEHIPPGSILGDAAEVVGVLEDVPIAHPAAAVPPIAWKSVGTGAIGHTVIETQLTAAQLQEELVRLEQAGEIEMAPSGTRGIVPLETRYDELIAPDRARGFLTLASATLVVLVAGFGFYGTQRYLVAAGRREYAIRAAIGAGPDAIGRLVLRRAVLLGLPGLVVGGLLAFIVVAWLRDEFVSRDISPALVTVWLVAGLVLLLLVASLGPAREAKRTRPAPLLRAD